MGLRSENEGFTLKDPSLLDNADEFGDGCHMQILTVFPNFVLQQIQNSLAVRQILPKGLHQTALNWTYVRLCRRHAGMQTRRLARTTSPVPRATSRWRTAAVGGFVQRGIAAAGERACGASRWAAPAPRQRRHARDRSLGARLLEVLSRAYGRLEGWTRWRRSSASSALQAAYIRCIDNDELEAWPDFFLEQCLYKVTTAENHSNGFEAGIIYADTKGMLIDRVAALREANVYEKQTYRHILGLPNVARTAATRPRPRRRSWWCASCATARPTFLRPASISISVRAAGSDLKFVKRIVVCDTSRFDTLLALPL